MFVVMSVSASEAEVNGVKSLILAEGMQPHDSYGAERVVIAVVGEVGPRKQELIGRLGGLPGVETVTPISRPFKLTSREFHPEDTVIRVLDATIGDGSLTVMAGPCSVESREQLEETARSVKAAGATVLRGGAFKPRTSPYSFQGLGVEALRYLAEMRDQLGVPVIVDPSHAAGRRTLVESLSLGAAAAGADGIIVEVHPSPDEAICDAAQQLDAHDFERYAGKVEQAAAVAGKSISVAA